MFRGMIYVFRCKDGKEIPSAEALVAEGIRAFTPVAVYKARKTRHSKGTEIRRTGLWPGYFFIQDPPSFELRPYHKAILGPVRDGQRNYCVLPDEDQPLLSIEASLDHQNTQQYQVDESVRVLINALGDVVPGKIVDNEGALAYIAIEIFGSTRVVGVQWDRVMKG